MLKFSARLGIASSVLVVGLALSTVSSTEMTAQHETHVAAGTTYSELYGNPGMEYWSPEEIAANTAESAIA